MHSFNVSNQLLIPLISHFPKVLSEREGGSFGYLWLIISDFFFLMSEFFVLDLNTLFMPLSLCQVYSTDVFFPLIHVYLIIVCFHAPRSFRILILFSKSFSHFFLCNHQMSFLIFQILSFCPMFIPLNVS